MINFNNTWCIATKEHEFALNALGIHGFCADCKDTTVYTIKDNSFIPHTNAVFELYPDLKQIKLNENNEFEYVEEEDENNTDTNNVCSNNADTSNDSNSYDVNPRCPSNFGFEPKESVEIYYKDKDKKLLGSINGKGHFWNQNGVCYELIGDAIIKKYNLMPIKKEDDNIYNIWRENYHNKKNINRVMIDGCAYDVDFIIKDYNRLKELNKKILDLIVDK